MYELSESALEERYQHHFGRRAGYLPRDRGALDEWLRTLKSELAAKPAPAATALSPAVAGLAKLIETDGIVRMYVNEMISQVPAAHQTVTSIPELLQALQHISTTAPLYNPDPDKRNFFPMSSLFVYMMMTPAGEAIFRNTAFNDSLRAILKEWCNFLDSSDSQYVLNTGEFGWLSPSAYEYNKLEEFVIPDPGAPHWGFSSFNDYFHRQIKSECRPVDAPGDSSVVVSANDGTVYKIARKVSAQAEFWLKGQPYSLIDMLGTTPYAERFVGGDVFQSFLSGADYHRWRAPIAGTVRYAEVVEALMFSNAESAGYDPTAGTFSQGYQSAVNTRGLVIIESPDPSIGMVCVMPIGITEISSVSIQVAPGTVVEKGEELGYFSYGGSSMCLIFQPGAIDQFTVSGPEPGGNPDDGPPIEVNARIAIATTSASE
ncbi:phosphatidylserine decarboxylase family protein [Haliangium ochraceum]|uniref:Phosphatidylserine decarboxylase-related protein n=1 Tax=Haliangium ochraceum (strain DSM 14365 / JCM 11303 / SMP-2) TaxID=502025 RepID=D0LTY5_HALO1|nr:phosphatidylserine decarboxylase family protein [Haliangium ochraceum]ACY17349.1 phosphatidylserine decarboxylase-related protein [Haliangium ochraceum DSM 14365]